MLNPAIVVTAILSLMPEPSPKWQETPETYRERVDLIAQAVADASDGKRQRAMAIVVVFWGESRFSPVIHSGERRGDGGKAICLGQHQRINRTEAEWEALAGTTLEATTRCARATGGSPRALLALLQRARSKERLSASVHALRFGAHMQT